MKNLKPFLEEMPLRPGRMRSTLRRPLSLTFVSAVHADDEIDAFDLPQLERLLRRRGSENRAGIGAAANQRSSSG
jgi:hypothetical protein